MKRKNKNLRQPYDFSNMSVYSSTLEKIDWMNNLKWNAFSSFYDYRISSLLDSYMTKLLNIGLPPSELRKSHKRDIILINNDIGNSILEELGIIKTNE